MKFLKWKDISSYLNGNMQWKSEPAAGFIQCSDQFHILLTTTSVALMESKN
jgi:hypothetical protein